MDAAQRRVPRAMPVTPRVLDAPWRLSPRSVGLCTARPSARVVLHRLLLGADGTSVRGRGDERPLDRSVIPAGPYREAYSFWPLGCPQRGRHLSDRGGLDVIPRGTIISTS